MGIKKRQWHCYLCVFLLSLSSFSSFGTHQLCGTYFLFGWARSISLSVSGIWQACQNDDCLAQIWVKVGGRSDALSKRTVKQHCVFLSSHFCVSNLIWWDGHSNLKHSWLKMMWWNIKVTLGYLLQGYTFRFHIKKTVCSVMLNYSFYHVLVEYTLQQEREREREK